MESAPPTWKSPSSLALIAANLLPLYGVLLWNWPIFPLLLLFWLENATVGALNILRILAAQPGELRLWLVKLLVIPLFCFHYGIFTLVHGVFVLALFGGPDYAREFWPWLGARRALADFHLWLPLAALVASHLFSFAWHYLRGGAYRDAELKELFHQPYERVFVLHGVVLTAGFGASEIGSPLWSLLLLIALKIALDLRAHLKEQQD